MGYTPQDIKGMSIWEYMAALDGFNQANDPDAEKRLSGEEKDELWAWLQGKG